MRSNAYRTLLYKELERKDARSAITLIRLVILDAHAHGASDIHIDAMDGGTVVRLRVDGLLSETYTIPFDIHQELIARLKILSGLRTDEHFVPQDGRFHFTFQQDRFDFDVRLSILPTKCGESAVLRLLIPLADASLGVLGIQAEQELLVEEVLHSSHGMILIVGATGSGKTTTLYSFIRLLRDTGRLIVSIEDPIEYSVAGVRQVQVMPRAGLTFAEGLRAILRQDPDIIVIGEIRDVETANLAVNAAYTGHLVLSTLHAAGTNNVTARLKELGVSEDRLALIRPLIVSQTLTRSACKGCCPDTKDCVTCGGTGFVGRVGSFEISYA